MESYRSIASIQSRVMGEEKIPLPNIWMNHIFEAQPIESEK